MMATVTTTTTTVVVTDGVVGLVVVVCVSVVVGLWGCFASRQICCVCGWADAVVEDEEEANGTCPTCSEYIKIKADSKAEFFALWRKDKKKFETLKKECNEYGRNAASMDPAGPDFAQELAARKLNTINNDFVCICVCVHVKLLPLCPCRRMSFTRRS